MDNWALIFFLANSLFVYEARPDSLNVSIVMQYAMQNVMQKIRSLKPNVSREAAIQHFTGSAQNVAANLFRGRVSGGASAPIAELYSYLRIRSKRQIFAGIFQYFRNSQWGS